MKLIRGEEDDDGGHGRPKVEEEAEGFRLSHACWRSAAMMMVALLPEPGV